MAEAAFGQLQAALTRNVDFQSQSLREALRFNPESPEAFSTFVRGLLKKKVDPTELFVTAALLAVDVDNIYLRYAALALRFGANPNSYVQAQFEFPEGIIQIPIHIGKRIWDAVPISVQESLERDFQTFGDENNQQTPEQAEERLQEKQRAGLDLLALMALKGFLSDAQITTAGLLTQNGINATRFANEHPEFFGSVYGNIMSESTLGAIFGEEIKYFEQWKGNIQNAYGINSERDVRILKYALLLDIPEVLGLSDIYGVIENLRMMFIFHDAESLKIIVPRLKQLQVIGIPAGSSQTLSSVDETLQLALKAPEERTDEDLKRGEMKRIELMIVDWTISYYNLAVFKQVLELGIVPDYSTRSQTIRAAKAVCPIYPAQCQILNTMVVEFVRKGYGLDEAQMDELSFSPATLAAVEKEYAVPAWRYQCQIREGEVNPDLRELARQVGIPINADRNQICSTLETLGRSDPQKVTSAVYEVNRGRILSSTVSAADILAGRRTLVEDRKLPQLGDLNIDQAIAQSGNGTLKPASGADFKPAGTRAPPLCTNVDTLTRPIEDYPEIDRVTYSDGLSTWCFTSDLYEELLTTGMNPWAVGSGGQRGAPIPQEVLIEIQQKLEALQRGGLAGAPGSISEGVKALFDANPRTAEKIYENESNRRLEAFYQFVEEAGIPRERFLTLTSSDFQTLADAVLDSSTRVVIDRSNSTLALRDFGSAVLVDAANYGTGPQIATTLRSILA